MGQRLGVHARRGGARSLDQLFVLSGAAHAHQQTLELAGLEDRQVAGGRDADDGRSERSASDADGLDQFFNARVARGEADPQLASVAFLRFAKIGIGES